MNCSRFRFLIQQKFDMDLAPQEERVVVAHLESCESCAKFHHQLQQVILAAEEVPLPDEMLPQKEGELARLIQQQMPQGKSSPFAFLEDFLGKFTGGKKGQPQQPAESPFPHRSNLGQGQGEDTRGFGKKKNQGAQEEAEEAHNAMGSRLKQMKSNFGEQEGMTPGMPGNQPNYESREMQSQTRSLGEKFGMAAASEAGEEHGLTLVESIRRKISETTKPPDDFDDHQGHQGSNGDSWQGQSQPGFAPPPGGGFANPNNQQFQAPSGGGFAPPPQNFQGGGNFANAPGQGFANAPQGAFQGAQPAGQGAPGFGQSPFEAAPAAAQAAPPAMGWAAPAPDGSSNWGAPVAPANGTTPGGAPDQGNWGAAAWENQGAPAQMAAPQANPEWSGQNNAPAAWNAPAAPDAAQGWTNPTNPSMPQPSPPANPGWGAPAQAAPTSDSWNGNQQQGQLPNGGNQTDSWSGANQQAPAAFAGAPAAANTGAANWGGAQPAQPPAWGQPAGNEWNGQQQPAPVVAQAPAAASWDQPTQAAPVGAAAWGDAPQGAAWGQPSDANNWGGPQVAAPVVPETPKPEMKRQAPVPYPTSELVETGTWTAFKPAEPLGPRTTPAPPKMDIPTGQAAPADARWDIPISERNKVQGGAQAQVAQAQPSYAPPPMPAPQPAPAAPTPQAQSAPAAAGWDYPGQQAQGQQGQQAQGQPGAPEAGHTKSGWDFPVYESDEVLTGPGWGAPAKPPGAEAQNPGANSSMDQLGNAIGDVARGPAQQAMAQPAPVAPVASAAQAGQVPNSWDLSIQERAQLQQQQAAAAQAAPFAPPQFAPEPQQAAGAWGQPPAAPAQDANGWGQPAAAPAWGAPPAPPAQIPPPAPAPEVTADGRQKLFAPIDDNAIDKLFNDNLGIQDAAPVQQAAPAQPPAFQDPSRAASNWEQQQQAAQGQAWGAPGNGQAPNGGYNVPEPNPAPPPIPQAAPPAPAPAAKSGLFNLGDDDMDKLFGDHLGITEPSKAPEPVAQPAAVGQAAQGSSTWNNLESQPNQQLTNPGWGQPPAPPAQPAWGQPPEAPAQAAQPAQAPAAWGSPPQAPAADAAWGAPPANAGAAAWAPPAAAEQPAPPAWGQPPVAAQAPPIQQPPANPFASMGTQYGSPPQAPAPQPTPQPGPAPQISPVQSTPGMHQAPGAPQKPANAGLFAIDDSVIDKIFSDNLGVSEGQARPAGAGSGEQAVPPPKIEGVGRLDSRVDHNQDAGTGRISSIGKFLLDQKDMEKLGKLSAADLSESSMRILTQEAAGELTTLLHHIASQNSAVIGSVIVGHDGLLIANTMPPEMEAESAGVWALGVYMNTAHVVKKMGQNRVHQIVSKTPKGYLVIADFGGGLLVVVSDGKDTDTLIPLMRSITQLVVQ